jgi:amino acid transporter
MSINDLLNVLKIKLGDFLLWLLAYLGGMLIMYIACLTIKFFHGYFGPYFPGYEIYLVTGTICLTVTGISYVRLDFGNKGVSLSPILSLSWPFLIIGVYGILTCTGVKESVRPSWLIWVVSILLFLCLMLWSSIIWLHEQGIRIEMENEPEQPQESDHLRNAADNFPKVTP